METREEERASSNTNLHGRKKACACSKEIPCTGRLCILLLLLSSQLSPQRLAEFSHIFGTTVIYQKRHRDFPQLAANIKPPAFLHHLKFVGALHSNPLSAAKCLQLS